MADETIETPPAPTVEVGQFVRLAGSNFTGRVMALYGDVARVTWPLDRIESDHAAADLQVITPVVIATTANGLLSEDWPKP